MKKLPTVHFIQNSRKISIKFTKQTGTSIRIKWSRGLKCLCLVRRYAWSNVGESPCRFKLQNSARITRAWLVKTQENFKTFCLLAEMTEELDQLWYRIGIDEDVHGWIAFSTKDFTSSTGCNTFSAPQWHSKNYHRCWKALLKCFTNTQ